MTIHTLRKNITNAHGQMGKEWLDALPARLERLTKLWNLSKIVPLSHMTWNYVATAVQNDHLPVVIKLICDPQEFATETLAIQFFQRGIANILAAHAEENSLLLEFCQPGEALLTYLEHDSSYTIESYAYVVNELQSSAKSVPPATFKNASELLEGLEHAKNKEADIPQLEEAISLKNQLLAGANIIPIHGDLHLNNIIKNGNAWKAIDPKGVMGCLAYEAAGFDMLSQHEMRNPDINITELWLHRLHTLSHKLNLDPQELKDWIFVRLTLSACWMLEDGGDPHDFL